MAKRRILVTAALPYANGPIHLGHLVEYIQADIWVRFQRLRGHQCIYICADDTHGTAIMIRAQQEGRSETELIAEMQAQHEQDFAAFGILFDNYGSTNSEENRQLCEEFWSAIRAAGLVKQQDVEQLYDVEAGTFLADRFVRGTCPNPACGAPNQPGDNCSVCGSTYTPAELRDPRSTLTGSTPEIRTAPHLFIELEQLHDFLETWTQTPGHLQPETANYLKGHFLGDPQSKEGRKTLKDWDISRPAPYFGFEIPDSPGNYWYVWFDAPIGYMASTIQWCQRQGEAFETWWKDEGTEIHHFIGKDITYFHTLFWPGILKTAELSLPTKVHIHGFLNVNGEKMSKSKGTFVTAATYANHLDPAYFRYFIASKLSSRVDDIDLNLDEFKAKVDSDLVGKVVNIASRTAKFVAGQNLCETYPDDGGLFTAGASLADKLAELYENCDYSHAVREIMAFADRVNLFIESKEPWKLRKDEARQEELRQICSIALNAFRQIVVYLTPVLPRLSAQCGELLGSPITSWADAQTPLTGTPVGQFQHMLTRVDPDKIQAMIEESKSANGQQPTADSPYNDGPEALEKEPM
ncbi:MAG: methionine--tRNA ligase, partial [Planctomycetaceae bacterium]|nr:methionine--tRNA ligase [Planctomycetaceae bacterium]